MHDHIFDEADLTERHRLFRRMAWACLATMALLFVAGVYWMSGPDAYHEGLSQQAQAPHWPDGSMRTSNDWWADPNEWAAAPASAARAPQ